MPTTPEPPVKTRKLKLRGHHLESVRLVHQMPRDEFIALLIKLGYITSPQDPYVSQMYDGIRKLFKNPNQRFLIVDSREDFICDACQKPKRSKCANIPSSPQFLAPVWRNYKSLDYAIAEQHDVQMGLTYTAAQIREKMKF